MSKSKKKSSSVEGSRLSRKIIEGFASEHRLEYPTAEKVIWLSRVLRAISQSPIGKDFALMGGSAIVFLYRDMYRFSTDLDLDFVGNKRLGQRGAHEIEQRIKADRKVLQKLAVELGAKFKVLRARPGERFVQYAFEYDSEYTRRGSVEVDMSYRYCHSVLGPVRRTWPRAFGSIVPEFEVQSLTQEELYAGKVVAVFDAKERLDFEGQIGLMYKRKIRHLFDLYLLADEVRSGECLLDLKSLRDLVLLFGMTRVKNFELKAGSIPGSYPDEDINRELASVASKGMSFPTVGEMSWTVCKFVRTHLIKWEEREYRFIEGFRGGNFSPQDLFPKNIAKALHGMHYYKEILGKVQSIDSESA